MRRNGNPMHVTGGDSYSEPRSSPARCRRGANPWGHNPVCPCRDEQPKNVRKSQQTPYEPDVEQLVDEYRDREQYRVDAEMDRQHGYE